MTSLQERLKLVVVLVDNHGYSSIGALSRSLGTEGFGTLFGYRHSGSLDTDRRREPAARPTEYLPTDLAANAQSLGAHVIRARGTAGLRDALAAAKKVDRTVVIHVEVDRYESAPSYESWWDVPVAETSETAGVREARKTYEQVKQQRRYL